MALSNTAFDGKLSATISAWLHNEFTDMFLGNNAIFTKIKLMGNIKTGGLGLYFVEPIIFPDAAGGGPQPVGVTDPYTTITQSAMTGFTSAQYTAAEYIIPVSVAQYDLDQQGSDTKRVEWTQANLENALLRMFSKMNADIWAAEETTTSAGARNALMSLRTLYNAGKAATTGAGVPPALPEQIGNRAVAGASTQVAVTLVGGIERNAAGAAYWCTPIINTNEVLTLQTLSHVYSMTVRNQDHADLIFVHRDSMDKIQSLLTVGGGNGGQFFTGSKLADAGFDAIKFRGADIIADDSVPTTAFLNGAATTYAYNIFAINTKYTKLHALSMKPSMDMHDDVRPLKVWTGRWVGQLTCRHAGRVNARHVNITN